MRDIQEGDKGQALCEMCGLTTTTYRLRDVPFSDGTGVARGIFAGVCDGCGEVVSIPGGQRLFKER